MRNLLILLIIILPTACAPRVIHTLEPTPLMPPLPMETPILATPDGYQDEIIRLAVSDLSARLSMDTKLIQILSAEPTFWPDSSLGCPQPGKVHAQVMTEGYLIKLEANDQIYEYHTDTSTRAILCDVSNLPMFPITPGEINDGKPWMPVD